MAAWNEQERDDFLAPPATQQLLAPRAPERISPDTEENVKEQTEDVFRNFVYQQYRNDIAQQSYNNIPATPELVSLPPFPNSQAAALGRQIARVGDDINKKYKDKFTSAVRILNIGPDAESAYEAFSAVARNIFAEGISWGRVVTLLVFGYHVALHTLRSQPAKFASFLYRVGQFLLQFLITSKISKWIADHGGWSAALTLTNSVDTKVIAAIAGLAGLTVAAVIAWNKYL